MRLLAACLAVGFGAALTAAAPVPKEKTNAEKLVGVWKLVKFQGEDPPGGGATVEFTKNGKMIITLETDGQKIEMKGTYKLVGEDKIDYKVALPEDGGDKSEVLTIKKLTDDELVTTDPEDVKEEFKRVKAEKKKDEKK